MEDLLQNLRKETSNPDIQSLIDYLLLVLQEKVANVAKYIGSNTANAQFNQALQNLGYTQNKNNTRRVGILETMELNEQFSTLLNTLVEVYPRDIVLSILRVALQDYASKTGDKTFNYRTVKFLSFLKFFVLNRANYSDEEIQALLENANLIRNFLTYYKDWQNELIEPYKSNSTYKPVRNAFQGNEKKTHLEALLALYEKNKEVSPTTAVENFATILFDYSNKYPSMDISLLQMIVGKSMNPADVKQVFAKVYKLLQENTVFKNIMLEECSRTQTQTLPCKNGKNLVVCRETAESLSEEELENYCKFQGGRRKTRNKSKRRQQKRRTTRRR